MREVAMESSLTLELDVLREQGYVVVPRFVPPGELEHLNEVARRQLAARAEPLEYEADLQYPGAPQSRAAAGGETVRRLLDAYARDPVFAAVASRHGCGPGCAHILPRKCACRAHITTAS